MSRLTRFISEQVVPVLPHGRLHVQRLHDDEGFRVVVTGVDAMGAVVEEREGCLAAELGAPEDVSPAAIASVEDALIREVQLALEHRAVLN